MVTETQLKAVEWEVDEDGNRIYEGKILIGVAFSLPDLIEYLASKRPELVSKDAEIKSMVLYPQAAGGGTVFFNLETDAKLAGPVIFKDVPVNQDFIPGSLEAEG